MIEGKSYCDNFLSLQLHLRLNGQLREIKHCLRSGLKFLNHFNILKQR